MKLFKYIFICLIGIAVFPLGCIIPFELKGIKETGGILVVEGTILNVGTSIKLSRTVDMYGISSTKLTDVQGALVHVIDEGNNIIAIAEQQEIDERIVYTVHDEISFTPGLKYALDIQIGEKRYQSAFVTPVRTPKIDEIGWQKNPDGSMDIMVSTHDIENKTEYYRWEFEEDWEYRSYYFGYYRYEQGSGEIIKQDMYSANNRYYCWDSNKSKTIILGTSEKLTVASIKDKVIHNFPTNNTRFSYLYSILVRQYGLDNETYRYLDNLKKNIELGGSLFAPQISEMNGNIRCLSDPHETVIGYIAATNAVSHRIYIDMAPIEGEDEYDCTAGSLEKYAFRREELTAAYMLGLGIFTGGDDMIYFDCRRIRCVDCTTRGGNKNKPDFWPNDHQ
jgi:hypothetical protein